MTLVGYILMGVTLGKGHHSVVSRIMLLLNKDWVISLVPMKIRRQLEQNSTDTM